MTWAFAWFLAALCTAFGWCLRWWIVDMAGLSDPDERAAYDNGFAAGYEQAEYDRTLAGAIVEGEAHNRLRRLIDG